MQDLPNSPSAAGDSVSSYLDREFTASVLLHRLTRRNRLDCEQRLTTTLHQLFALGLSWMCALLRTPVARNVQLINYHHNVQQRVHSRLAL